MAVTHQEHQAESISLDADELRSITSIAPVQPGGNISARVVPAVVIGLALFASGASGLINQVVWQRSLKLFLGGSDSASSTVVVLVFMAGLGIGSYFMGRRAHRFRSPLKAFGTVEAILAVANLCVCGLLASGVTSSVFALQRVAMAVGVPLLLLYAIISTLILSVPCLLMGATMPLAAESCQRSLGVRNSRLIGLLFFVNTIGSVAGTVFSSGTMISTFGLQKSLVIAAGMNLLAGAVLVGLAVRSRQTVRSTENKPSLAKPGSGSGRFFCGRSEVLAAGLGFCSLGYEMYLFRLISLRHQPLPFTFAAVLTGFLVWWSIGAALSSYRRGPGLSLALRVCALLCVASIPMFAIDSLTEISGAWSLVGFVLAKTPYFLPCLVFGWLFGRVTADAATSWGADVGRINAWNTLGSCLGIITMTFIGYEIPFFAMVLAIALLVYAMQEFLDETASVEDAESGAATPSLRHARRWMVPGACAIAVVSFCLLFDVSRVMPGQQMYSGKDGVIILKDNGDMIWDGLWHSSLSKDNNHVGSNNWALAVAPAIAHSTGDIRDVCVVGAGTGITAGTFAKLETVERVDAYDIARMLQRIYDDHPEGTLGFGSNPKINMIWQDARTGMALNPKKYDVIQAQPMYLKQAGSALLNSVEFLTLVRERLKPQGVFCLYSNGTPEQAFALRETADHVFPHRETFFNGYLLVLSNDPIQFDRSQLAQRLQRTGPFWDEVRSNEETSSVSAVLTALDQPKLPGADGRFVVTDDRPFLEYPNWLGPRVAEAYPDLKLPAPRGADLLTAEAVQKDGR